MQREAWRRAQTVAGSVDADWAQVTTDPDAEFHFDHASCVSLLE
jgi:hypothetical protein